MSDMDRLLRIEELMARIGLRRIKIYAMVRECAFPKPC
jgi:predicted DNA-binding transcriptional regulator AlpA